MAIKDNLLPFEGFSSAVLLGNNIAWKQHLEEQHNLKSGIYSGGLMVQKLSCHPNSGAGLNPKVC